MIVKIIWESERERVPINEVDWHEVDWAIDTSAGDITHETPKKQQKTKPKPKDSENICRICRKVILSGLVVLDKQKQVYWHNSKSSFIREAKSQTVSTLQGFTCWGDTKKYKFT